MPANEQTRVQRIEQALAAGTDANHPVMWRGEQVRLPVIRLPLEVAVLNPRSHRIRAQLESIPQARSAIAEQPDGEAAQGAIAELLRATPGFERLKQNLAIQPQKEPGIVTRQGQLINANTRAVALRDLGREYIDVAVLPPDASLGEIYDLELELQVAEDFRQDYSFTNQLLFVDDLINDQNRNEREVALRLHWATPNNAASVKSGETRVQRYVRHLALIRDIQAMSGGKVPLTDFDEAEQALQEFDTTYEGLRNRDPVAADRLRRARTLGLLVNLGYERQRQVDADWVETHLVEAFAESEVLGDLLTSLAAEQPAAAATAADDDGDAGLFDDAADAGVAGEMSAHQVVATLVERLAQTAHEETVTLPTENGDKEFDRATITAAINDAMRIAAEDAKSAARAGNDLKLPAVLVEDAAKRLARARTTYKRVATRQDFDGKSLREQLEAAERALDALKMELGE